MRIEVVPAVGEIRHEQIRNRVVVVIDVLRASSTIVTALQHGFAEIIPTETAGQALALRDERSLLAGERYCRKHPSFDFNNSPTALCTDRFHGKRLILCTTNGTRAIQKAEHAQALLIGSLLNATACITHALSFQLDVTLYCAGTREKFALEDGIAAGMMVDIAKQLAPQAQVCDLGNALHASYLYLADRLEELLAQTATGKRLLEHRFEEDIRYCSQRDRFRLVPVAKEGRILPTLVS
jgi:2-phosphosulfolactate phosphatase